MTSPVVMELTMQDRQRQVEQAAARYWQRAGVAEPRRAPLRIGAGWVLLRVGARLADLDPAVLSSVHTRAIAG